MIFNFHGYPTLIHKLAYRRANHENFHVHGCREKGNINTPFGVGHSESSRPLSVWPLMLLTACRASQPVARMPKIG